MSRCGTCDLYAKHIERGQCANGLTEAPHPAPAAETYTVIADLHEQASGHRCTFGCDSPYAVNCNCAGRCSLHTLTKTGKSGETGIAR